METAISEMSYAGVILPDGRIDTSYAIPDDVECIPLTDVPQDIVEAIEDGCSNPDQLDHYLRCRANGCNRKLAACLATRSFPGVKTDSVFNEGKFSGETGRIGLQELWRKKQAEAVGVSTNGKWYCSGLASFPGDPTAWVDSRGDVLRIAKEKNMTVHGYVEHKGHETYGGEDLEIADDIIESEVQDILDENPGVKPDDVREKVYALRTGKVDPNPLRVQEQE